MNLKIKNILTCFLPLFFVPQITFSSAENNSNEKSSFISYVNEETTVSSSIPEKYLKIENGVLKGFNTTEFTKDQIIEGIEECDTLLIPKEVKEIFGSNMYGSFENCFGTFNESYSNNIKYLLFEDQSSCLSIGERAFSGCESFEVITLPDTITKIEKKCFYDCVSLKSVTLSNNIKDIPQAAFACTTPNPQNNTMNFHFPDGLETIGTSAFS